MIDLVIALALMAAVVGPLLVWVTRTDARRRAEAGGPASTRKEEVA